MNQRVVEWVNRAYEDIQRHRTDWKFRQELASISVVVGQWQIASLRDQLEHLDGRSITAEFSSSDIQPVELLDYDLFYRNYQSKPRTNGRPVRLAVANNWDLYLDPIPSEALTLKFWYTKTIDTMTENTDEPIIRAAHHDTILWHAVKYYAEEEEAEGVYQTASINAKEALNRMELDLRPKPSLRFRPLA